MDPSTKLVAAVVGGGAVLVLSWIWLDTRLTAPPAPPPIPPVVTVAEPSPPDPAPVMKVVTPASVQPPVLVAVPAAAPSPQPVPTVPVVPEIPVVQKTDAELFYEVLRFWWRQIESPFVPDNVGLAHVLQHGVPRPAGAGAFFLVPSRVANAFPVGYARKVDGIEVESFEEAGKLFNNKKIGDTLAVDYDEAVAWNTPNPQWESASTILRVESTRISLYEQRVQTTEDKIERFSRVQIPVDAASHNDPLFLYVQKDPDGRLSLMLEMNYWGSESVFAEGVILAIGENPITLPIEAGRDVVDGRIHERAVKDITADVPLQKLLVQSDGEFLIRFQGASKQADFALAPRIRENLKVMMCVFYAERYGK